MKVWPFFLKNIFFVIIACVVLLYSGYLAVAFSSQPPLDAHAFRQTQTSLTAYWFIHEGFKVFYETPVGGPPWVIPFEFPLYQMIVAFVSKFFSVSLDATGRVVSYVFLLLCLIPIVSINKKLGLSGSVLFIFVAVTFSAPTYVYWGRSFMIETAALFFAIAAIKYFVDFFYDSKSLKAISLFVVFSSLSILQKATTMAPILCFLSLVFLIDVLNKAPSAKMISMGKRVFIGGLCFVVPLAIGVLWVDATDKIKLLSPLGSQLTSAALSQWNWGSVSQKLSLGVWYKLVWERSLVTNIGAALGLFILIFPFFVGISRKVKIIIACSLALGLLPFLLFTNLHFIHNYYQTANMIFFMYAVAISLGEVVLQQLGRAVAGLMLFLVVASNFIQLDQNYLSQIKKTFGGENRDVAVGGILKRELPRGMQFVAFGNDWSSSFSYISQRKSFTVPKWFAQYDQVISDPEKFVEKGLLGGVVACSPERPNVADLIRWSSDGRSWKLGEVHGCLIATPERTFDVKEVQQANCRGGIDSAMIEDRSGYKVVSFAGWVAGSNVQDIVSDSVFVVLSTQDSKPFYFEALSVPRIDVNKKLELPSSVDIGFSRILAADLKPGEYEVRIVRQSAGSYQMCQMTKNINIHDYDVN